MFTRKPNTSPNTPGLTRALWRQRLKNWRNWSAPLVLIGVLALLGLAFIRVPAQITFTTAQITGVVAAQTDYGARPTYSATTPDGRSFAQVTSALRSQIVLSPGDTVCLRIQTDRFTGRVTAQHAPEHPDCRPPPTAS